MSFFFNNDKSWKTFKLVPPVAEWPLHCIPIYHNNKSKIETYQYVLYYMGNRGLVMCKCIVVDFNTNETLTLSPKCPTGRKLWNQISSRFKILTIITIARKWNVWKFFQPPSCRMGSLICVQFHVTYIVALLWEVWLLHKWVVELVQITNSHISLILVRRPPILTRISEECRHKFCLFHYLLLVSFHRYL